MSLFAMIGSPIQLFILFLLFASFVAILVAVLKTTKSTPNAELRRVHLVFSQATSTLLIELTALRNSTLADSLASQVFAQHAAAFAKYLAALRSVGAPASPFDYRDGYNACVAYAEQTRDFFRDKAISCAQHSPKAKFTSLQDVERRVAELNALTGRLNAIANRCLTLK